MKDNIIRFLLLISSQITLISAARMFDTTSDKIMYIFLPGFLSFVYGLYEGGRR